MSAAPRAAAIERLLLVAWITYEIAKGVQIVWVNGFSLGDALVVLALGVMLLNTVRRPNPIDYRSDAGALLPCFISLPLTSAAFAWSEAHGMATHMFSGLELASAAFMLWAVLSLGSSFTLLPATIKPRESGAYAIVRHPLYASYLAYDIALALQFDGWLVWAAIAIEAAAFTLRAHQEEKLLAARFPSYALYAERVRWRFVPFLV
jgi:protein-S-isoprenylcysteine O-methyltransferase Ste14